MSPTREECIEACGRVVAAHDFAMAQMTPREQAEAAFTPVAGPTTGRVLSVDELEDRIRAQRGLPPLRRQAS